MLIKIISLFILLSITCFSATPIDPTVVAGFGTSFIPTAPSHLGGWVNACYNTATKVYTCFAEDFVNGTTSSRIGLEKLTLIKAPFYVTIKGDAGVATGSSGTAGSSYGAGASFLYDIQKDKRSFLVFSVSWLKSTAQTPITLKTLGNQLTLRLGFIIGK